MCRYSWHRLKKAVFRRGFERVDWNFTDYEAQNIYDESFYGHSFLFGYKARFNDVTENKERYTTGGVNQVYN